MLGFVRFPDNSVGTSRMFYASYTDRNNLEGGSCFNFDFVRQIDTSSAYVTSASPNPFIDKPSLAVDKDGMIVVSYTLFTDAVKSKIVIARSARRRRNLDQDDAAAESRIPPQSRNVHHDRPA